MIFEPVRLEANGRIRSANLTLSAIQRAMPGVQLERVPIVFTLDTRHHKHVPSWAIGSYLRAWKHRLSHRHLWVNPGVEDKTERLVRKAGGESLNTLNMTTNATRVREGWYGQRVGLVQAMMVSFLAFPRVSVWCTD